MTLRAPREGVFLAANHPSERRKLAAGDTVWVGLTVGMLDAVPHARARPAERRRRRQGQGRDARFLRPRQRPVAPPPGQHLEVGLIAKGLKGTSSREAVDPQRIALDHVDPERMRPGMSVKVEVEQVPRGEAFIAPRESLDVTVYTAARVPLPARGRGGPAGRLQRPGLRGRGGTPRGPGAGARAAHGRCRVRPSGAGHGWRRQRPRRRCTVTLALRWWVPAAVLVLAAAGRARCTPDRPSRRRGDLVDARASERFPRSVDANGVGARPIPVELGPPVLGRRTSS